MSFVKPDNLLIFDTKPTTEIKTVEKNSIIDATVGIHWKGQHCQYSDWRFIPNINLSRDYLPLEIEAKLTGQSAGTVIKHTFQPGELVKAYQKSSVIKVNPINFQPQQHGMTKIQPRVGRFYPKDFFARVAGIYQGNSSPCRINSVNDDEITIDLNHPLAGKSLEMELHINSIRDVASERGGRCNDIPAMVCNLGPGLQDSLLENPTEFFHREAFNRLDENNDSEFFATPDLEPFWDTMALAQVSNLYRQLIPDDSHVLDLMAGAHSPLQESTVNAASVSCAGLNLQELRYNPICNKCNRLNVNSISTLPYADQQMDVVLIHAAIEYVTQPNLLMTEIVRILKPGGRIIITYSNRSVDQKAIQLWRELYEFERPALVQQYLINTKRFTNFNSYSIRDLFRPEQDKLAGELLYSDPIYAIWADKVKELNE